MGRTTSEHLQRLHDCVLKSFRLEELALMARLALGRELGTVLSGETRTRVVAELLEGAEYAGRLPDLLEELGRARPADGQLHGALRELRGKVSPVPLAGPALATNGPAAGAARGTPAGDPGRRLDELRRRLWAAESREEVAAIVVEVERLMGLPPDAAPDSGRPAPARARHPDPTLTTALGYLLLVMLAAGAVLTAGLMIFSDW